MNSRHRKTLEAIFTEPVPATLEWGRIEALFGAVGAKVIEGRGSRVRFELNGAVAAFRRTQERKPSRIRYATQGHF